MVKDIEVEIFLEGGKKFKAEIRGLDKVTEKSAKSFSKAESSLISLSAGINLVTQTARGAARVVGILVDIGGAAIQAGVDFEEANQKFNVVFDGIQDRADATRENLVKNFGLSRTAATELLSATGDLLTGFGFTEDAALDLSNQVQTLSVDLASFSNLQGGASRASEILTKALLGERDALVSLGVKIGEADVKARLAADGTDKFTGAALRQAKAQATLALIIEQTGKAQGDFARSSDSLANQQRVLEARMDDVSTQLGQVLVPITKIFVGEMVKLVDITSEWIDNNKEIIASALVDFVRFLVLGFTGLSASTIFLVKQLNNFLATIDLIQSGLAAMGQVALLAIQTILEQFAIFESVTRLISAPLDTVKRTFLEFAIDVNEILENAVDFGEALLPQSVIDSVRVNADFLKKELASLGEAPSGESEVSKSLRGISEGLDVGVTALGKYIKEQEDAAISTFKNSEAIDEFGDRVLKMNLGILSSLSDIQSQAESGELFKSQTDSAKKAADDQSKIEGDKTEFTRQELDRRKALLTTFSMFERTTLQGQVEEVERIAAQRLEGLEIAASQDAEIKLRQVELEKEIETNKQLELAEIRAKGRENQLEADKTFFDQLLQEFDVNTEKFTDASDIALSNFRNLAVESFAEAKAAGDDFIFSAVTGADDLGASFEKLGESLLKNLISTLTNMLIQQILFNKATQTAQKAQSASSITASSARGAAGVTASVFETVPWPASIPVAAAAAAAALGQISAFQSLLLAQSGIETVTSASQPAMLHKGETVLTRDQTANLVEFLGDSDSGRGRGGGIAVEFHVENLTLMSDDEDAIGELTTAIRHQLEEQNLVGIQ